MKNFILAAIATFTITFTQAQTKVGDATLPNTMELTEAKLVLNGAGIREKVFIDLYAAGLYTASKSKKDAKTIVNADETMAMKLDIVSSFVSSEKMIEAVNDGFDASLAGDTEALSSEIETFKSFFSDEIVKGVVFDLIYIKDKGATAVYRNGELKGEIKGMDFKKALFGIWLGKYPADKDLKKDMLKG